MFAQEMRHSFHMSADLFQPEHFRDRILERMEELDLNSDTIGDRGGPSTTKLTDIRKALPKFPRTDTFRKLDKALRWKKGSARAVALGGEPVPLPPLDDMDEIVAALYETRMSDDTRLAILAALEVEPRPEAKQG